ncbi:hypothetical protein ACFV42_23705 [Streptomyces solisilvae]|uniref:hypothetical protein n=1 Tax=Streptomyces malaysiensis TaxID=92644 RepID=UPI0036B409A8
MTLYNPGIGMGRTMHIRRVHALQALEKTGLITFRSYSKDTGYHLSTAAGEPREVGTREVAAYMAGMLDLYCSLRLDVDSASEGALETLDDKYLDALANCLDAVLPPGEPT